MPTKRKPNGLVVYHGPSMLDGRPIVLIVTGIAKRSNNAKTGGDLLQTWILRADQNPLRAARTGADISICGDCKARGKIIWHKGRKKNVGRVCYVRLYTAPNNIWKTWKRGRYPQVTPQQANIMLAGRIVRGGSYGDPAAVPYHVWRTLQANLVSGAAYTHQWRHFPELASFCMASVDTSEERAQARLLGFRTFRVRGKDAPLESYEADCPASPRQGFKTTCSACRACGGHRAKARCDISIEVHANRDNAFAAATLATL